MKKFEKILCTSYYAVAVALFCTTYAHAYIDPSVMTYTIQIVAGVMVAVGAVVGILWRKAKKKVSDKLGIDENRNKEVESDDILIDADAKETEEEEEVVQR